jgi:hypothetical protein
MASSSAPDNSATNKITESWQVTLFRKTHSRGWEQYLPNPKAFLVADNSSNKKSNKNAGSDSNLKFRSSRQALSQQRIGVTPRKGWVEMKDLRLRITLYKQQQQQNKKRRREKMRAADFGYFFLGNNKHSHFTHLSNGPLLCTIPSI